MSWLIVLLTFLLSAVNSINKEQYCKISVIIPAYNEEGNVGRVVGIIKQISYIDDIVVINDGSTDKTKIEAEFTGARVISNEINLGKGSAIAKGITETDGDIIAIIDADIPNLTSSKIEKMFKPVLEGKADITKTKFTRVNGYSTELKTKPLLKYLFPEVKLEQPLNGQFVARRKALKNIIFEEDYGVDIGIILDANAKKMKIVEIDIGETKDGLYSLQELNLRANGVFRTIIDRAIDYGRFTMIDSSENLKLFILSLTIMLLGLFISFFVRIIPMGIGIILVVVGLILAFNYFVLLFKNFFILFRKNKDKNIPRSFLKMHYPLILTVVILFLITVSFIGATNFNEGTISIDSNSRKFVIYTDTETSIPVVGPYMVDSAIENETNIIRIPLDAMDTLGISSSDSMTIDGNSYNINQSRTSEQDVLRIPIILKEYLNLSDGDIIQNIDLNTVFNKCEVYHTNNINENLSVSEDIIISNNTNVSYDVEIVLDDAQIVYNSYILNDFNNYKIAVNYNALTIHFNGSDYENTFDYNGHVITVKINKSSVLSVKELVTADKGVAFNIIKLY